MSAPSTSNPITGSSPLRVAILYKRFMPLDEQVMRMLETQLTGYGFHVFTDKHLTVGVDWAKEIEARIKSADAVVPIISSGAAQSEMIAYEVEIAHEAAQRANGRPRIFPVRVSTPGELPELLARILDPIQYYLWRGAEDDQRLVGELVKALQEIPPSTPVIPAPKPTVLRL